MVPWLAGAGWLVGWLAVWLLAGWPGWAGSCRQAGSQAAHRSLTPWPVLGCRLLLDGSRGLAGALAGYIEINRCYTDALDINHGELDAAYSVKRA